MESTPNTPNSSKLGMAEKVSKLKCFFAQTDSVNLAISSVHPAVSAVAPERPQQFMMEENKAYEAHTHHPQETDLNGYYDTVECKEVEGNDYIVIEPVYDLPS